jgi:hypothetical protein
MRRFESLGSRIRPVLAGLGGGLSLLVVGLNVLSLVGFLARDRTIELSYSMYLPLFPIGVVATGVGLLQRRSKAPRLRAALVAVGLWSTIASATWMFGQGAAMRVGQSGRELTVLHWNVLWGGYWNTSDFLWRSMVAKIVERDPDILVMSEAPPFVRMYREFERLPGAGSACRSPAPTGSRTSATCS